MLLVAVLLLASLAPVAVHVLSPECQPSSPSLPGPGASTNATAWRDALTSWRTKCIAELRPNGQVFDAASFDTTYVQPSSVMRCKCLRLAAGFSMIQLELSPYKFFAMRPVPSRSTTTLTTSIWKRNS